MESALQEKMSKSAGLRSSLHHACERVQQQLEAVQAERVRARPPPQPWPRGDAMGAARAMGGLVPLEGPTSPRRPTRSHSQLLPRRFLSNPPT